jgi:hypothetical protein
MTVVTQACVARLHTDWRSHVAEVSQPSSHRPLDAQYSPNAQLPVVHGGMQLEPLRTKPGLHVKSQLVPLQVAVALAGGLHGVHREPHVATLVFDTHCPEHACIPAMQVKPQLVPLQVAVALAGGAHGVQLVAPHEVTSVFATHDAPQRWNPGSQVKSHWPEVHAGCWCAAAGHTSHRAPQLVGAASLTQL